MIKYTSCPTIPKVIAQAARDKGIVPATPRSAGQSLCAQLVPRSENYPLGVKFSQHPSRALQDALSNFILALPREIRTMIYTHFLNEIKPQLPLAAESDQGRQGDVYMYHSGCWRKTFPEHNSNGTSLDRTVWDPHMILEYDAMPARWTNLKSFFHGMTFARHLRSLDGAIVAEVIQDLCLCTAGSSIRLDYEDDRLKYEDTQDTLLYESLIYYSHTLTLTLWLKQSNGTPTLQFVHDTAPLLRQSQRLRSLKLWIALCSPILLRLDQEWWNEQLRPLTELVTGEGKKLHVQLHMCDCCTESARFQTPASSMSRFVQMVEPQVQSSRPSTKDLRVMLL